MSLPLPPLRRSRQLVFTAIFFAALSVGSPQASANVRDDVDAAFAAGAYERVELLALRASADWDTLPADDCAHVYLTTGFALIMLERASDARNYFRRALDADPTLRLDPVRISPKFRMVFDDVKATYIPHPPASRDHATTLPIMRGPQARSVMANLLLPGSGQWLEGRRGRGAVIAGAQLAAAGALVWRLDALRRSRDAYLHEHDRTRVTDAYDRYYDDTRWAWCAGIAAGIVYLAAQTDLALFREGETASGQPQARWDMVPDTDGGRVVLRIRW
ncbi:MAG: hypothetical protein PHI18_04675 [bacterium]|nr:hypothetical protein [bacterium]